MKSVKTYIAIGICVILLTVLLAIPLKMGTASSSHFSYGTHNLNGATPDEIAKFAVEYTQNNEQTKGVTPQVLLSRYVRNEELPTLGFDCIPFDTIEQPPLALVIMKGKFFGGGGMSGIGREYSYLAYIFDVWSATPTFRSRSVDGSNLRLALNDNTLPTPNPQFERPPICPTSQPTNLHYGDTVPTPPRQATPLPAGNPLPTFTTPLPPPEVISRHLCLERCRAQPLGCTFCIHH